MLKPGERMIAAFRYLCTREVALAKDAEASKSVVKARRVVLSVFLGARSAVDRKEFNVIPALAPVD